MKRLIALFASIGLVLVLVLSSCAQQVAPTTPVEPVAPQVVEKIVEKVVYQDKVYRALNPQGIFIPVDTKPLAPRLDTIDGKTIYVCQGEADPVIMPALYKILREKYPKTTFIYYARSDFGPNVPGTGGDGILGDPKGIITSGPEDSDILKKVQAVIRGIGW